MNLQPTLENELVKIRPLKSQDLEPLYNVAKDPLIWEQHPCKRHLRNEFEKFFAESIESKGALIILDQNTGKIIGSSRFETTDGLKGAVEIGWTFLGREYWGGKHNQSVKNLMMGHAFKYLDKVIFYVAKENIRSQKAMEKINGQKISEMNYQKLPKNNKDNVTYIINKPGKNQ